MQVVGNTIDGVNDMGVPLPNIVVENIQASNALGLGATMYIGNAVLKYNLTPQEIAEKVSSEELDLPKNSNVGDLFRNKDED